MKYGLIGKTLVHSYSKEIHEALEQYTYDLFSLSPEDMPAFVKARDFGGLNVTIPYKQDVIPLCDEISDLAASIGAVNTLYWKAPAQAGGQSLSSRRLVGHNTDYEGFLYTAARSGIDFDGKTVLILGTGGTSLMARKAAADQGAAKVYIASRSVADSDAGSRDKISQIGYPALPAVADSIQIIVNTTPVGTYPNNMQSVISLSDFPGCESVIDVIYNPFKTKLLLDAERAGLRHANGLPMLVAQATAAAGYFLGRPGTFTEENERIIKQLTTQMQNIVLMGMPGSGKSTIGRILAEKTGKRFADMDDEIVTRAGKPIPQIFDEVGETGFRDLEAQVAFDLGKERGMVIATGGGIVLRSENIASLRQNGLMIHIERPVNCLPMNGRPLSKDLKALQQMERIRMPLYRAAADKTFDNSLKRMPKELSDAVWAFLR